MAIIIGEVVANIGGDSKQFEQSMDGVKQSGEKAVSGIEDRFRKMSDEIGRQGRMMSKNVTAPIVAIGAALFTAANRAANFADEIDKMSIRSGVSRKRLQELRFVTDQVGVEFGSVERAVDSFRRRLLQADEGSGRTAEILKGLGVDVRDATGEFRDMDSMFPEILTSLSRVENETERGALAMQIFGRSASDLAPLLAQGEAGIEALTARAHELGLVMGDDAVSDLVQFKDQMAEVQQQAGAVAREFGMVLLPIVQNELLPLIQNRLVPAIRQAAQFFNDLDDGTKKNALTIAAFAAATGPVMMAVGAMGKLALSVKAVTTAMLANPYMAAGIALLAFTGYAIRARRATNQLTQEFYRQLDAQLQFSGTMEDNIRLVSLLNDAIQTRGLNTNSEEQNRILDERIELLRELIQLNAQMIQENASNADVLESTNEQLRDMANNTRDIRPIRLIDEQQGFEHIGDELERILDIAFNLPEKIFPPGSLGAIQQEVRDLSQEMLFMTDPDRIQAMIFQIESLQERMRDLKGETEDQNRAITHFERMAIKATESLTKGLADAIVYGNNFKDVIRDITRQLASRALQQFFMIALTGGTGGAGAIAGGLFGRIFGVGDALIRSNGDVVQFHPNDNIAAFQGNSMPGGSPKSIKLHIPLNVDGRTVWEANRNFEIDL